jgi:hypothetical protein
VIDERVLEPERPAVVVEVPLNLVPPVGVDDVPLESQLRAPRLKPRLELVGVGIVIPEVQDVPELHQPVRPQREVPVVASKKEEAVLVATVPGCQEARPRLGLGEHLRDNRTDLVGVHLLGARDRSGGADKPCQQRRVKHGVLHVNTPRVSWIRSQNAAIPPESPR